MLWFTFERNWFSLMFSCTLSSSALLPPAPSTRRLSFVHTNPKKFVWGQHNTKHFSFSFFSLLGIINIASNISFSARFEEDGNGRETCHTFSRKHFHALDIELLPGVGSYWRCRSDGERWKILKSEKLREFLKFTPSTCRALLAPRPPPAYGTFNIIIHFSNHQTLSYETTFYASWSEVGTIVERGGTMKMTDRAP